MDESLAAVGLSEYELRSTLQLSVGERKRVCLAGVLACRPAMLALDEFVLWVNAEKPYKTAKEYVDAAKAANGTFKMGGTGSRQEDQIITVAIEKSAKVKFTYIPFRGGGEVAVQLVGNHVNSTVKIGGRVFWCTCKGLWLMAMVSGVQRISAREAWESDASLSVHDAPDGADAMAVADAARVRGGLIVYVARDAARAADMVGGLQFFAPDIPRIEFPAWDCLPYDRVSPSAAITAQRMAALSLLASERAEGPLILITTVNAASQAMFGPGVSSMTRQVRAKAASVSRDMWSIQTRACDVDFCSQDIRR